MYKQCQNPMGISKICELAMKKRWVYAYRVGILTIVVNTNNGVERKNRDFKKFLMLHKGKTITGMLTVLIEQFHPDKYSSYMLSNLRCSTKMRQFDHNKYPHWMSQDE